MGSWERVMYFSARLYREVSRLGDIRGARECRREVAEVACRGIRIAWCKRLKSVCIKWWRWTVNMCMIIVGGYQDTPLVFVGLMVFFIRLHRWYLRAPFNRLESACIKLAADMYISIVGCSQLIATGA
ncbi:hypothetical protein EDC94DRAFT_645694, partial [Helicostylum pulchrum]